MFGIFKKKSNVATLEKSYRQLMDEYYRLSTVNRAESYKRYAQAEEIMKEIEKIKNQ